MDTFQQPNGRTVVITGGTSGLGYGFTEAVLREYPSWHVVFTSHTERRTRKIAKKVSRQTSSKQVTSMELDLGSLSSVRTFVGELVQQIDDGSIPPLHALICNGATQRVTGTTFTEDGFEATFAINQLGHFLLVNLLVPYIEPPGRILFIPGAGSEGPNPYERLLGMAPPRTDYENAEEMACPEPDPDEDAAWVGTQRYATSKLANVLTAYELSDRLRETGTSTPTDPITANVFGPGLMPGTALARDYGAVKQFLWHRVMPVFRVFPSVRSPERSGRDMAWAITEPEIDTLSGEYIDGRCLSRTHDASYDEALRDTLWEECTRLVELESKWWEQSQRPHP